MCGLCNRFNRLVLRRDAERRFQFASLQSAFARTALARHGREARDLDTLYVLVEAGTAGERLFDRSDAVLYVLRRLRGLGWLATVGGLLPSRVRDAAYGVVVRNRYRLFGRYDACPLPPAEERARFIEV